jgi:glycosyltransferase involved in cell wall biosynthesis
MPAAKTLSIIIPAYNEERTIKTVLLKVKQVVLIDNTDKELIVVNDFSTDQTEREVKTFIDRHPEIKVKYVAHAFNQGKGAAIRTGIGQSTGEYVIIQDADLEYDPNEYNILLQPMVDGYADVVFGSRFVGGKPHRILFFWHSYGNNVLTLLSNLFTNLNLTDMEVGFKMFKSSALKQITLKENRFGFEPEVTAKISRVKDIRIYEVGISYYGRTYSEGKKINWRDGVRALYCILKYNIWER